MLSSSLDSVSYCTREPWERQPHWHVVAQKITSPLYFNTRQLRQHTQYYLGITVIYFRQLHHGKRTPSASSSCQGSFWTRDSPKAREGKATTTYLTKPCVTSVSRGRCPAESWSCSRSRGRNYQIISLLLLHMCVLSRTNCQSIASRRNVHTGRRWFIESSTMLSWSVQGWRQLGWAIWSSQC